MKYLILYGVVLFVGIPLVMLSTHIATLPDDAKEDLVETAKDLNGRIYTARISCGRGSQDHIIRVHGRSREDARNSLEEQLRKCSVEILEGESEPIWQKALREAR